MKKEISIAERPERFTDEYLRCCGNMSWYDTTTKVNSADTGKAAFCFK